MDPIHTEDPGSFWYIMYGVLHDWVPHAPSHDCFSDPVNSLLLLFK